MTKVICSMTRCDGPLYFECKGHSEYINEKTENNDACVAVSTLCSMLVRYALLAGHEPQVCKDGHVRIDIEASDVRINEVFKAAMLEFSALAELFPGHIKVY